MSQEIQSFYRNVQEICVKDNVPELISYVSTDGLVLLKQLLKTELDKPYKSLDCGELGPLLLGLIPVCYSHVSEEDAEKALRRLPSIESMFNPTLPDTATMAVSNLFQTLDCIFDTIVRLFYFHSNPLVSASKSEIANAHVEIAQKLVHLALPPLSTDYKTLWFYQKTTRSSLLILRQIISLQPSTFTSTFASNPIGLFITTVHNYLSASPSSDFLVQLAFDLLQGFTLLIESTVRELAPNSGSQRRSTADLLTLMNHFLTGDYFPLFTLLSDKAQATALLVHCTNLLKLLKNYRRQQLQRKQSRHATKTYWEHSSEKDYNFHHHQTSFEIILNAKHQLESNSDDDEANQTKRVCVISAFYEKLLRLTLRQFESSQPSYAFIKDCLAFLTACGSCSCYSLTHYRAFLSKLNHLKLDENLLNTLEQQSIRLLRQAFLLSANCSRRDHHHHHYDSHLPDNTIFWSYLASHVFQRPSRYAFKLVQSFPDLIQCCSNADKQLALKMCLIPTLEHYHANSSPSNTNMIEYLVQTLPHLLFDLTVDLPLNTFSDTLVSLSSSTPSLLVYTLPVFGCLLTSASDRSTISVSESFLQFIIKLTNTWPVTNDAIDNLCHILIILLQKSPQFRQAFYAHSCYSSLFERCQAMLTAKAPVQASIIACVLVANSYYTNSYDEQLNYKRILEHITSFSEENRHSPSWFELLVRLSLSQQYQDKRMRWRSSSVSRNSTCNEADDESTGALVLFADEADEEGADDMQADEFYQGDVESLSDDRPVETVAKHHQTSYSNLVVFPELIIVGLKIVWQNVDNEWNDNRTTARTSLYLTNLVNYLELLSSLARANTYNCIVLKKLNVDENLFHCLLTIVRRASFTQKDVLISLIITLLQSIWSQSMTVHQLDQCFKLLLTHRALIGPLLRLFKHLVHQIDSNQPRSFCSMPLSSTVGTKGGDNSRVTLDQLSALKYPHIDDPQNATNYARQSAFVTETLKTVQVQFPLTVSLWLRVNYPFDKHEAIEENSDDGEGSKKDGRPMLHLLTLHHEGVQLQFSVDSKAHLCFRLIHPSSSTNELHVTDAIIRLHALPRESWSHLFVTMSRSTNTIRVCLNGQTSAATKHPMPPFQSSTANNPWSISLGQQSLDTCTSFYYDLGSILLFDKVDFFNESTNDDLPAYLYSLGSDHWHFLTGSQQPQSVRSYWIYQRFTRVRPSVSIDHFELELNAWHSTLKRSLLASYTSNKPWTLFLFNTITETNDDQTLGRFNKILPFRSSGSSATLAIADDSALSPTTTATISLPSKISLEQSSHILNICEQLGGILNFIYLFGKMIELNAKPLSEYICHITDIIFTSIWKIKSYHDLFNSLEGYHLLVKILTTNECARHLTDSFLDVLIEKSIVPSQQRLFDINLFRLILLDWKIWCNHSKIFCRILQTTSDLLSDQSNGKYWQVNRQLFKIHFTLEHLLMLCQELIEEQQEILIDEKMTQLLGTIIEALVENDINIIALLMNFVLLIHPLCKTYVTYNKEHFYFVTRPFDYYRTREKHVKDNAIKPEKRISRIRSTTVAPEESSETDPQSKETPTIRKSHSFSDLLSSSISMANDTDAHHNRRAHHLTVSGVTATLSPSKTFNVNTDLVGAKDSSHDTDLLSTGILRLLTNIALTTSDRLMIKLIDHVFRLNILTVLLLDASMSKRVQCLKLLDIILTRMEQDKVHTDVIQADLHTMLANQLYNRLDGRDDEKELMEICVSIALQRPIQFDLTLTFAEQIHDADQYFSIVSSTPSCPRSQVGFALLLSLIEKLSMANVDLCQLLLHLLDELILRASDENRHFLVDIGLPQVLLSTLLSAISNDEERLISSVQKCLVSLMTTMFTTAITNDVTFASIIDNIIGTTITDQAGATAYRRILHQTLCQMLTAIIDSIEKPPSTILSSSYPAATLRNTLDDSNPNLKLVEYAERFRRFLQLAMDYIHLFHHECSFIETFTLRLLDVCLLGVAYLIEKRSNHATNRHQWSSIMLRSAEILKQMGQKLFTMALDPDQQSFFFRIEILKHIIAQPNGKAIIEYLLANDAQCAIYHQILIYLQILAHTTPNQSELQPALTNDNPSKQKRKSFDSGHSTIVPVIKAVPVLSNGEDSSSHTVNIAVKPTGSRPTRPAGKRHARIKATSAHSSSAEEEPDLGRFSSSANSDNEHEAPIQKISDDLSSSSSLSASSFTSENAAATQQLPSANYSGVVNAFRDLMRGINLPSLISNDSSAAQRRALTEYLLAPTSSAAAQALRNTPRFFPQRHSFNWPPSVSTVDTTTNPLLSPESLRRRSNFSPSTPSPSPLMISWLSVVEEKHLEYTSSLQQMIESVQRRALALHKSTLQTFTKETIGTIIARAMEITQDVITLQGFERKKFLEHLRLTQSLDLRTKHLWHQLIAQLTHEYGIWFEPGSYPKFWELDPTESPQRERRRLQRSYCLMEKRFFQNHIPTETLVNPPLSYLFDTRHYQSINIQTVLYRNEKIEFQCRCTNVTPNHETRGELLVGTSRIYFVADEQLSAVSKTKKSNSAMSTIGYNHHSFNDDSHSFSLAISDICEMYKRRYMLKEKALELFFINGITLMIAHTAMNDRDNLYNLLSKRTLVHFRHGESLIDIQQAWKQGHVTNFEYLMQLNKLAGRTYLDLMQYPVYPYVVATYDTNVLDLRSPSNYRNLLKPIAVQHPDKEEKFIEMYNALEDQHNIALAAQQEKDNQPIPTSATGHQSKPYHFASLYSNSGVVLHYLIRLLPYTRMFVQYQGNNFDCADRTFHDVKTSYWLSSFESTSDYKELIPEFYYLSEFLRNKQGFNFGARQSGEKVSDVAVPAWSKRDARLYVCGLRQALESDQVTNHLHQWIDLIFGYKQKDKAALAAINVYHAGCYFGFPIEKIDDEVIQSAYHNIIRTYGQIPKQLFLQAHPSASTANSSASLTNSSTNANDKRASERLVFESKLPLDSIHRQIIGVRWGDFVGSYDMPSPDYISSYDCPVQVTSFVVLRSGACIICLPSSSLVVHNEQISNELVRRTSIGEQSGLMTYSTSNSSPSSLDTMVALKWNTPDGIVRCRQLRQMKNWYHFLVPTDDQDKITCCSSIDHRLLFLGKTSGLIEIYRIQRSKNIAAGIESIKRYLPFIAHRSPITCLFTNRSFSLLISASADGMLTLWDTNRLSYVRTYKQDNQPIYHLTSSETTGDIAYLSSSGSQWHLSYLTCNCDLTGCLTFSEQLNCLCFTSAPEGTCVNVLLGGFENGRISMWSTWDLTLLRQLDFEQLRKSAIVAICVSKVDRRRLYVADRDRHLHTIESRVSSSATVMPPPQILFLS